MKLLTKDLYERDLDFKIDSGRINLVQSFQITFQELKNIRDGIIRFKHEPNLINASTKSEIIAYRAKAQAFVDLMKDAVDFFHNYAFYDEYLTIKDICNNSIEVLIKINQSSEEMLSSLKEN